MPHPSLSHLDHRPWPLPASAWVGWQTWSELLFAHWPVPAENLRRLIPAELKLQEFGGSAWIGLVPFRMEIAPRFLPALPGLSRFPELNVRTYVEAEGKPGVWFFSLDAANRAAVWAAKRFAFLPYFYAKILCEENAGRIRYESRRVGDLSAVFRGDYGPIAEAYHAQAGTLEHWLTERYCLYCRSPRGQIYRIEVHHEPWRLQKAEAKIESNTMFRGLIDEPRGVPLLHFAKRIDVATWLPQRVS